MKLNLTDSQLHRVGLLVIATGLPVISSANDQRTGETVYRKVCSACHGAKVPGAPQLGDRGAWKKLFAEGQATVTAHGWVGIRGMPAKGGQADMQLEEFARAVAYMARSAGGDWQDPDAELLEEIREEEKERILEMNRQ